MSVPAVEFERVTKAYVDGIHSLPVLQEVNLRVEPGELTAIIGTSGSGKSTLLHLAGGLDRRYQGAVRVNGQDLGRLSDGALSAFRARTIGFVFQAFNLLPGLNALENVLLPGFFQNEPEGPDRAHEALAEVGLGSKAHRRPGELSGGERQRVALARALYSRPSILLADEPTGNLDARTGGQILELLKRLNADWGTTMLVVTHETELSRAAGRVLRLADGRVVEERR